MEPRVTNVTERNVLGQNQQVMKAIVLTYYVGPHGPFTLITNQADLNSGAARLAMQQFAHTLNTLPLAQPGS